MRKVCKTVKHFCNLPKANKRRWRKGLVHVCLDCHEPYYIAADMSYTMDGSYQSFEWIPLNKENDNE